MGNAKRLAWLAAAVAVVLVALAFGKDWERADAWSQPPTVFTVIAVACGRRKQWRPATTVTFTVNETPGVVGHSAGHQWDDHGRALRSRAARSAACTQEFAARPAQRRSHATLGVTGAGSIPPLVVSAVVRTWF